MIIITVALFEGLFMFYLQNYYYNSAKQSLISQATYTMDIYDGVGMESTSFENKVHNIFEKGQVSNNTNFTVEFIDKNKNVILDKYKEIEKNKDQEKTQNEPDNNRKKHKSR